MFNLDQAIAQWRRQMISAGVKKSECLDELESHLREEFERSAHTKVTPEDAFERAVNRLGDSTALAIEFQKSARAERWRILYRSFCFGAGVFLVGALLCYFAVVPLAVSASAAYVKWLGFSPIRFDPGVYHRFAARLVLGLALSLEVPVILWTLVKMRFVDRPFLSKARKYVLILNLVLGAAVAGPGIIPQLFMFLFFQGLYELSVLLAGRGNTVSEV